MSILEERKRRYGKIHADIYLYLYISYSDTLLFFTLALGWIGFLLLLGLAWLHLLVALSLNVNPNPKLDFLLQLGQWGGSRFLICGSLSGPFPLPSRCLQNDIQIFPQKLILISSNLTKKEALRIRYGEGSNRNRSAHLHAKLFSCS